MKKLTIYVGLTAGALIIVSLPFLLATLPYAIFDLPTRRGVWGTLVVSLIIFPVWLFITETLEILIAYLMRSRRTVNALSLLASAALLFYLYYLLITPSLLLSALSTALIFCIFMALKPWIEKNSEA